MRTAAGIRGSAARRAWSRYAACGLAVLLGLALLLMHGITAM